ncbi:hypothetical protein [Desulfurobacterium atlanticum]|uniref:Uncharacterized protein n=1 Tax=Desulfurobacterium atlanticum TaxID=240169 RepID=A0A238YNC0_9BACT|nr:hypothetical protein [Desulfurobacterium atlanticum]SNR72298.1 hypothetical protein SAMN06265340_10437 [Desulfurobacterium atlanticum]
MRKVLLTFLIISLLIVSGCWFSGSYESEKVSANLFITAQIPVKKGTFFYTVRVVVDGVDLDTPIMKEWSGLSAGEHTFSLTVPEGKKVVELVVYRDVEGTLYPVYSGYSLAEVTENTAINLSLSPLFNISGVSGGITTGEYPLIRDAVYEINGDGVKPVDDNFTVTTRYILDVPVDNEYQNVTKVIWKEFLSYGDKSFSIFGKKEKVDLNLYYSDLDKSSEYLSAPFGLYGFTSSLYDFDGTTGYRMVLFTKHLEGMYTYDVSIERTENDTLITVSEGVYNDTREIISLLEFTNRTVAITGVYRGNLYPAPFIFYSFTGNFSISENLSDVLFFPEGGFIDNGNLIFTSFGFNKTSSSLTELGLSFSESLPEPFYLSFFGVNKLNLNATYFSALREATSLYPVALFDTYNVDGLTSLTGKVGLTAPFKTVDGYLSYSSSYLPETGDRSVFEGVTSDGKFVRVQSPVTVSGNVDFQDISGIPDVWIDYRIDSNSFVLQVNADYAFDFCDVEFLKNENRKFFAPVSSGSPLEEYLIFKGLKQPLKVYRKVASDVVFIKGELPPEESLLKIYCYNDTYGVGKVYRYSNGAFEQLFKFPDSITDGGSLPLSVDSFEIVASWSGAVADGFATDGKKLERFLVNGTEGRIPIVRLLNMSGSVTLTAVDYKSGVKKQTALTVNKLGVENVTLDLVGGNWTGYLTWDPILFNGNGTCSFNILDSYYGSQNDTWSIDVNLPYYEYVEPYKPDFIYAVEFCNDSGNYTLNYYLYKVQ